MLQGYGELAGRVEAVRELGLAVVRAPRPLHYYSSFSHTIGCDYVVRSACRPRRALAVRARRSAFFPPLHPPRRRWASVQHACGETPTRPHS